MLIGLVLGVICPLGVILEGRTNQCDQRLLALGENECSVTIESVMKSVSNKNRECFAGESICVV